MGSRICFYWKHEVSTWPQMTEKVPHFDFQASWITIFFNLFIKLLITFLHKNLNPKFHWFWLIDSATILFTFYQSNGENSEFEIRNCFFYEKMWWNLHAFAHEMIIFDVFLSFLCLKIHFFFQVNSWVAIWRQLKILSGTWQFSWQIGHKKLPLLYWF